MVPFFCALPRDQSALRDLKISQCCLALGVSQTTFSRSETSEDRCRIFSKNITKCFGISNNSIIFTAQLNTNTMKKPIFSIGVEVQLFPGDTHFKFGIIREIDNTGYTFEMTDCSSGSEYKTGDIIYWSHSKPLTMKLKKINETIYP